MGDRAPLMEAEEGGEVAAMEFIDIISVLSNIWNICNIWNGKEEREIYQQQGQG